MLLHFILQSHTSTCCHNPEDQHEQAPASVSGGCTEMLRTPIDALIEGACPVAWVHTTEWLRLLRPCMMMKAAALLCAHCRVVEERTASAASRSLMSATSLACSSTLRPSRKPLKKSLVLAYIILALIFAASGAL